MCISEVISKWGIWGISGDSKRIAEEERARPREVINEPVQNAVQCTRSRRSISLTYLLTLLASYHSPVLEMALSSNFMVHSNIIVHGSTINKDSESGMHSFKSIQKKLLIDDPMKDLIPY